MVIGFIVGYISFIVIAIIRYKIAVKTAQVIIAMTVLLLCAIQDIKKKKITIGIVILAYIISAILMGVAFEVIVLLKQFAYSLATALILYVISFLTKNSLGEGDILILSALVFITGPAIAFAIFSIASILLIFKVVFGKEKKVLDEPLVPYLFIAAFPLLLLL